MNLADNDKPQMYLEYVDIVNQYKHENNGKNIVFYQVGSFYEAYAFEKDGEYMGANVHDASNITNLALSGPKPVNLNNVKYNRYMMGAKPQHFNQYLADLMGDGWYVIFYKQVKIGPDTFTREFESISTPGTYFNENINEITNNFVCIWINKYNRFNFENICCGVSNINIYTGKTALFEFENKLTQHASTYDDLEKFISVYRPNEVLFIHNLEDTQVSNIIKYCDISCSVKTFNTNKIDEPIKTNIKNCTHQKYQIEILKKFLPNDINEDIYINKYIEIQLAVQSLCYLLEHIYRNNPLLVSNVYEPVFENYSNRLVLSNSSLIQLNIINKENRTKHGSILSLLNNCVTPMGKRNFEYDLLNPITNKYFLNECYDLTQYLIDNELFYENIKLKLKSIKDIEKTFKMIQMDKINPNKYFELYENFSTANVIFTIVKNDKQVKQYLDKKQSCNMNQIESNCEAILNKINNTFNLENIKHINIPINEPNIDKISSLTVDDLHLFKNGYNKKIDELFFNLENAYECIHQIKENLSNLIRNLENKKTKKEVEYIKIKQTKQSFCLMGTSRRIGLLMIELKKSNYSYEFTYFSQFQNKNIRCKLTDINDKVVAKDSFLSCATLDELEHTILNAKEQIINQIIIDYENFNDSFKLLFPQLRNVCNFISDMDIIQNRCYTAVNNNYCKPNIIEKDKSFVSFKGMRHCLIEKLQSSEIYIDNDLSFEETSGYLLYGPNTIGKTSFVKSIGIAIIMAQSGNFVPCSEFNYFPFENLFTRILNNDNLFKGQSTFAVEISELTRIFDRYNKNSLVLGDEVCSGTEKTSANSLFCSVLAELDPVCKFIFATHFYDILDWTEFKKLQNTKVIHMAVEHKNGLIYYNRKIKENVGSKNYGIEIASSLGLNNNIIERAMSLRRTYFFDEMCVLDMKTSHFNSKKIRGMCEKCGVKKSTETHHLHEQKYANEKGFISTIHKNMAGNLLSICSECHDYLHENNIQLQRIKTSDGYKIEEIK